MNTQTPCKMRKRRFSSSSFARLNQEPLVEKPCSEPTTNVVRATRTTHGQVSAPQDKSQSSLVAEMIENTNHRPRVLNLLPDLQEVDHTLITSNELLKLLAHIWLVDTNKNHVTTITSLVSTLTGELTKAQSRIHKLIQGHKSTNYTSKNTSWKLEEQTRRHATVKSLARELEVEKKLRQQMERLNKKLGKELATTKTSLLKATKEAKSEKTAREIFEGMCEELIQGFQEDRVELEEIKKKAEKVREDVEEEREMLQIADMLREERVHMKLSDAKYEYEEKHEQVNKLKIKLEELLKGDNDDKSSNNEKKWLKQPLKRMLRGLLSYQDKESDKGEVVVEKNLTNVSVAVTNAHRETVAKLDDETPNSRHEVQASLERNISDCIEWEFDTKKKNEDKIDENLGENLLEFASLSQIKEYEDELERYKMIKDLRDHIVYGSGLASSEGFMMLQEVTKGQ